MLTEMSGEFVRSGELPATALPIALIGLLSRMRPQVCLQVRALRIGLRAAVVRARVMSDFLAAGAASAASRFGRHYWCDGRRYYVDDRQWLLRWIVWTRVGVVMNVDMW
jgi:hypothetical protein